MNEQRYQIRQGWKNAEGEWVGVLGGVPDHYRLWYYVEDTHYGAPDWNDDSVFESVEVSDCIDECNRLNVQYEKTTRQ